MQMNIKKKGVKELLMDDCYNFPENILFILEHRNLLGGYMLQHPPLDLLALDSVFIPWLSLHELSR